MDLFNPSRATILRLLQVIIVTINSFMFVLYCVFALSMEIIIWLLGVAERVAGQWLERRWKDRTCRPACSTHPADTCPNACATSACTTCATSATCWTWKHKRTKRYFRSWSCRVAVFWGTLRWWLWVTISEHKGHVRSLTGRAQFNALSPF